MRALIVGAGAVGTYLAARLRLGGHEPVLLARPATADAIARSGVTLRIGDDEWPVSVGSASAAGDRSLRDPFELAVVALKAYSTAEAIESLRAVRACAESTILNVQNGLGNEEAFAAAFGADRIAAGALTTAVEKKDETTVVAAAKGGLSFAPVGSTPHNWLLPALESTGLRTRAAGDWRALKWSKLCMNLIANGVCAALDWTPAQVYANAGAFAVERESLVEAVDVMRRLRIAPVGLVDFPVPLLVAAISLLSPSLLRGVLAKRVAAARGDKLPSLLIDVRSGRKVTEVDALNGAVARAAEGAGASAPANAAIARIVSGIASGAIERTEFRGKPDSLAAEVARGRKH
ncbi:MAG TPA: 2-dehydropantoate 2-reductase [Candidatus Eremiobacteraceae bacterium]|nr:2-dehydropantoate 2-reductase [Candidatus Eremiobacteraceae bacterium]